MSRAAIIERAERIVISWDFLASVALSVLAAALCPRLVSMQMARDFYSIGVSVLSIVFSVFFAALAIIITAGDNEFVAFLHEDGAYEEIVWSFKFTVGILFIALLAALTEYGYSGLRISQNAQWHSKWFLVAFLFSFLYSLLAVLQAVFDAIRYSNVRVRYLNARARLSDRRDASTTQPAASEVQVELTEIEVEVDSKPARDSDD